MATKDKLQTTAGSWALLGSIVPRDAHIVSLLRDAGAIVIGHANMSEWSSVRSKKYSTGYSARGGQVRNPYDLCKSPSMYKVLPFANVRQLIAAGGSSSGSAVAVSANIVPLSFGTETDTSIIGPASVNGVVDIKPTVGLTSRSRVIPHSQNLDTIGCFGRCVADAAHGLDAIAGTDERDCMTQLPDRFQEDNYSSFVTDKSALKGATFGFPRERVWDLIPEELKKVAQNVFDAIGSVVGRIVDTNLPCANDRINTNGSWDW